MSLFKTAMLSGLLCLPLALNVSADDDRKLVEKRPAGEPTTDLEFLTRAIACEVAEVKCAEKAAKSASSEEVRRLAQTIADDHKKIREDLMGQAKRMKLGVVEGMSKEHREMYERLAKLDGKEFDREYVRSLVDGHEKSVKMYKKWAKDAKESGVREAAEAAMTKSQDHLEKAKKLQATVKE